MEVGETTVQAARRETLEEANASVEVEELYTIMSLPHIDQVYMMFRGRLSGLEFSPGAESEEVKLFELDDIPWTSLAFPTILYTLRFYVEDRRRGGFRMRCGDIVKDGGKFSFRFMPAPAAARDRE
jgi:ADP-ribose pyrophosphatase YjhB (NUDIX family)